MNRNINMNATVRYSVEFLNSGLGRALPPFITVTEAIHDNEHDRNWNDISVVLIFGLFTFSANWLVACYEHRVVLNPNRFDEHEWKWFGPTVPSHRIKVTDIFSHILTMTAAIFTWYWLQAASWYTPSQLASVFVPCIYSEAVSFQYAETAYGILMLLISLELVFMCDSVPRLNVIGRTLRASSGPIAMFVIVYVVIMCGFSLLFYILYTAQIEQFSTVEMTFFTLFRGMLGDIPLDEMMNMRPALTVFVFIFYCIITLFTIFTVLIAIISDACE